MPSMDELRLRILESHLSELGEMRAGLDQVENDLDTIQVRINQTLENFLASIPKEVFKWEITAIAGGALVL